jgi:excisionase family DNA binding protein
MELYTKREVAMRVRISERTLDRLIAKGTGPAITRIGSRVLFRADLLARWIEAQDGARSAS